MIIIYIIIAVFIIILCYYILYKPLIKVYNNIINPEYNEEDKLLRRSILLPLHE
jgi:hypothetical protein